MSGQQPTDRKVQVRNLNNQLLEVYTRLLSLPGGASAAAIERSHAASVIKERAAALQSLIREEPEQALLLAFPQDLLTELAEAFPQSAADLETAGEWEGTMSVIVEDAADLTNHRTFYRMFRSKGTVLNLHFATGEPADLESGQILRVQGVQMNGEVAAAAPGDSASAAALTGSGAAVCSTLGEQPSIVLLVNMPGTTPPPAVTVPSVQDIFFGASGHSVSEFWRENSYGKAWATGEVHGWYTLDQNYTCDQYPSILDAAIRAADADVDFSRYSRVFVIISGMTGNCGWSGTSYVGCGSQIITNDGTFTVSTSWMLADYFSNRDDGVKLSIHEGGHLLGLRHASSRDFGTEALGAPGVAGTLSEYGDYFSAMGFWNFGHYAAPHKAKLGWLTSYQTVTNSGGFSVQPLEYLSNSQALKIQRGTDATKWLWLEFRNGSGLYDSLIGSQVFGGGTIHYEDSTTGTRTHLLDFNPGTATPFSAPALTGSWVDPYSNLSIRVDAASSSALGVDVTFGAIPCVQAAPSVTLSPANPSAYPGDIVSYTLAVTNNDNSSCAPRNFGVSSILPDTWTTGFSQSSLTIAPSSNATTTMTKTVPAAATAATYSVQTTAASGGNTGNAQASLTVKPLLPVLSVALTIPYGPYKANSTVPMAASAMLGTNGAVGGTVTFTIVSPKGVASTKRVTIGSSGAANYAYRVGAKDLKGVYTVTAIAVLGSQTATSSPAAFTVQ